MQGKDCNREPHHPDAGAEHAERVHAFCMTNSDPLDERGHPGGLHQQGEQHQHGRYEGFACKGRPSSP